MDRLAVDAFVLVRVVDAGSFSSAATQLRMGQSAVSKAIAQLEERLSVRLLLRTARGLRPTEAGWNFYERAKRSIEEADGAEFAARGAAATLSAACAFTRPCFRVTARHTASAQLLGATSCSRCRCRPR
jgi:DNA-binding transcriptional LysR family regulator